MAVKILRHETCRSEFSQISYISFLFALRVPSVSLTLIRAYQGGELSQFLPPAERALIGLRGQQGERLIVRFARRKNLPQWRIMSRPCFCQLSNKEAHHLCPFRFFRPLIRQRVRPRANLFPRFNDTEVNNAIKAVLKNLEIPHAERYSSHGVRRGAANELKTQGSQWTTVATLGEWRSLCFRGYVDLTPELGRDMSKLLIATDDIDSDMEDEVQTLGAVSLCVSVCASDLGCCGPAASRMGSYSPGCY